MTVRSRLLTILVLAAAAIAFVASNSRFTILDDEGMIASVARNPVLPTLKLFVEGIGQHEHPPLSDILLHDWMAATNYSLAPLRVFANIFYIAGVFVVALAARRVGGGRAYWTALLLGLAWPYSFQYGRIAGWYAVCFFLIALVTWLYLKVTAEEGRGDWIAFGICAVLLVWVNYFGIAVLLLLMADLLLTRRDIARKNAGSLAAIIFVVAVACIPLARIVYETFIDDSTASLTNSTLKAIIAAAGYPLYSVFVSTAVAPWYWPLSLPASLAIIVLLACVWRSPGRCWLLYWAIAMVPLAISGELNVKRMLFLLPWLFLAISLAMTSSRARMEVPAMVACGVLVIIGWAGILSGRHYATTNLIEPWNDVARVVSADARGGATVVSGNLPFIFYLNYELDLKGYAPPYVTTWLGEEVYRSHGYSVFAAHDAPSSLAYHHGKIVLANGAGAVDDIEIMQDLDDRLRARCAVLGGYHAMPDPAAALKTRFLLAAPVLNYRTNVTWFDCP